MPFTNDGVARMLNGGGLISATQSLYVSMHSAQPTASNELTGTNPPRIEIESTEVGAGAGFINVASAQDFAAPTADRGTATHYGIYSAATGGTLLAWTRIVDSNGDDLDIALDSGTQVRIPATGLQFTIPLS